MYHLDLERKFGGNVEKPTVIITNGKLPFAIVSGIKEAVPFVVREKYAPVIIYKLNFLK